MDLLVQLLLDDEIGRLNNLIEDGDFLGDGLLEADFLENQADVLVVGSIVNIVALVEDGVGKQVVQDEVVELLVVLSPLALRKAVYDVVDLGVIIN